MRAIQIEQLGGPEVLTPAELPTPTPGAGEALMEVEAIGVNFIDVYHRTGLYPRPLPFVPGSEAAGTVVAVGPEVTELKAGDRIGSTEVRGAYASHAIVPADRAVRLPDSVGSEVAAAALLQGMTAHYLVCDTYRVQPGDTVLVHAAAGGVGLLLTQLATRLGARVIATVSTPEKVTLAREAGAAEVILYGDDGDGLAAQVRRFTGSEGVAAVYDGVGASTFDASLASLRVRGTLALFGQSSGPVLPLDPQRLQAAGSVYLTRPTLLHYIARPEDLRRRVDDLLGWVADGSLKIRIGLRRPLEEAREAHEDLQARRTTGKVLLIP